MILGPVFEQFIHRSPLSVMARATVEHALSASALDALFDRTAERGYQRQLLFSTSVDLMSLVVCGTHPHVQAAFQHLHERVPVTLKCVYEKLQNIETTVSAALVHHVAGRCQPLITELGGACQPLLPGYQVRILDGNHLAATQKPLQGIAQRDAFFVVRRHGNMTVVPQGEFGGEIPTETGWVSERRVWVHRDGERVFSARLIRVRLKRPTEDGDLEVEILTNLAVTVADAVKVASLYLKRWKIEGAFHELTVALCCEVNTLGYPKAALFGFCVAVTAYHVLAVVKAALRGLHGEKKVQEEVSGYYMALEWSVVLAGMMIALPAEEWERFGSMSAKAFARYLRDWATKINLKKIKKAPPRKPTKQKTVRIQDVSPHLSTARLLEEAKKKKVLAMKLGHKN